MLGINNKVTDILRKIRFYLEEDKMSMDNFPLDSILEIVENTLGPTVWGCIGSKESDAFKRIPSIYKEWFEDIVAKKNKEDCIHLLELFENSYKCLYTAMGAFEKDFREGPYRKMIIELGNAYADIQYRLHMQRQEGSDLRKKVFGEGKGLIYTCVVGTDSCLYQPTEINENLDYICFTNIEEKWETTEGVWVYRKLDEIEGDSDISLRQLCNQYKILAPVLFKEYDFSVWISPDMQIVGDIVQFSKAYGQGYSFLGFPLSNDDCIYNDERKISMSSDEINISIRKALFRYREEGYPEHNGIVDSNVLIRSHRDEALDTVMRDWWEEAREYEGFGDNCFAYVAWKNKFEYAICNLFTYYNIYFKNMNMDLEVLADSI